MGQFLILGLTNLGAQVNKQIYSGMGHTIIPDELDHARKIAQSALTN